MKFDIVVIPVMQLLANTIPIQCLGHTWYPVCVDGWHEGLLYRGKIFAKLKISHFSHFGPIHKVYSQNLHMQAKNIRTQTAKLIPRNACSRAKPQFFPAKRY